jgi:hypothetical protein
MSQVIQLLVYLPLFYEQWVNSFLPQVNRGSVRVEIGKKNSIGQLKLKLSLANSFNAVIWR